MASILLNAAGFVVKTAVIFVVSAVVIGGSAYLTGTVIMPFLFGVMVACGLGQLLLSD